MNILSSRSAAVLRNELEPLHVTILDRYLVTELSGPALFGGAAFTLIFVATQFLAIGRLVSQQNAPLLVAIEYFLWEMPAYLLLVIPMAMLFGTLLSMGRLSGESEITALKAGGVSLYRMFVPLAVLGLAVSLASLVLQEALVPLANDRAAYLREAVIEHLSPAASNLSAVTDLPGGGKQVTIAGGLDASTQTLLNVTVLQYDAKQEIKAMIVSERAHYDPPTWTFINATTYHFTDGDVSDRMVTPGTLSVDIGERPSEIAKRNLQANDPENLSRSEIKNALDVATLSDPQRRLFTATYAAKLARPFSAFVFVLLAFPLGMRRIRDGGAAIGFGVALAIVFVYYVITTIALALGSLALPLAGIAAWAPNALFSLIGLWLLRRASAV
ncbi:MAG TPA: LptF/LptG family permease [Candidatus Lustribacter sp.]|nr:LptF/LptG family permease [Candidatus Lustribacter sp.]